MWREPPDFGTWGFRGAADVLRCKGGPDRSAEERSSDHAWRVRASPCLAQLDQPREADELHVILEELAALESS